MAYDRVTTPRFWINYIEFFNKAGIAEWDDIFYNFSNVGNIISGGNPKSLCNVNPDHEFEINSLPVWQNIQNVGHRWSYVAFPTGYTSISQVRLNFGALLNHNCFNAGIYPYTEMYWDNSENDGHPYDYDGFTGKTEYVNYSLNEDIKNVPEKNGFSIWTHNDTGTGYDARFKNIKFVFSLRNQGDQTDNDTTLIPTENFKFSGIMAGRYFDLDAPDMSITKAIVYDSVAQHETIVGSRYTNVYNSRLQTNFQLYDETATSNKSSKDRTGKRVWELSFKKYEQEKLFNSYSNLQSFGENNIIDDQYGLNIESSFYSEVIHKTLGGTIPFIFQPDKNDKTNFALCKLDTSDFNFTRLNKDFYDFSIKIVEI